MMAIEQILEGLRPADGIYKRKCIDAAVAQQAEITPHLIRILREVAENPDEFLISDRMDHIYALMLLQHFREASAHEAILDVFSLPEEYPFELFGDIVTEDLPAILCQTCGGQTEGIRTLAANGQANVYCRSAAQDSLVHAVIDGFLPREEVVEFFRELLTKGIAAEDVVLLDHLLPTVHDLYPEELMPLAKEAYDRGLVPSFLPGTSYEELERAVQQGKEAVLEATKEEMLYRRKDDIHAAIEWWTSWNEPLPVEGRTGSSATSRKRTAKKSKRKMAKKSKRKNRRKKK